MLGMIIKGIKKGVGRIKRRRRARRARRDRANLANTIRNMSPAAQRAVIKKLEQKGKLTIDMMIALDKAGVPFARPPQLLRA